MRNIPRGVCRGARTAARAVVLLAFCVATLTGCEQSPQSSGEATEDASQPVVKTTVKGPVTMTVSADKGELSLADRLHVTVEVTAEENVDVEMPAFGERFSEFSIRDFRDTSAEPIEGGRRWTQEYELDVFLSGDYTVPELTAMFTDRRDADDVIESGVTSEEFTVTVKSLMEGEFDPTEFADIRGPVELPMERSRVWMWWVSGGLATVALAVLAVSMLMRRLRRPAPEVIISAHEWAFERLQALIDEQLVEKGQVHEFYFRLSMIVREYIERRFGLSAAEWTTEEFLVYVQRDPRLPADYRTMLGEFLLACDMVKFALYEPEAAEIERAFNAARDFVDQTADRQERQAA